MALHIRMLGGFRVSVNDTESPAVEWRSRNASLLVKRLALAPDYGMLREQLVTLLWPEADPSSASNSLRQALHIARRHLRTLPLDPDLILVSQGERVVLYPPERVWCDVPVFEEAARAAYRATDPDLYWAAIEHYTGSLLPDDVYEDWTTICRDELTLVYHALLEGVAQLHEERGENAHAIEALRRLVASEPTYESVHAQLMRLYADAGRHQLALRQYQRLRSALKRVLDVEPEPETQQLYESIKGDRARLTAEVDRAAPERNRAPTNLPHALTTFIGRKRELRDILQEIDRHRLVTLTGPGGIGKTRLALEASWQLVNSFPDGVWLVELAGIADPDLVLQTVTSTLGIEADAQRPLSDTLERALRDSDLLLVLDNCEHVIDACAGLIQSLLRACSKVRVLATSREALRVAGERQWPVPSLPLPAPDSALSEVVDSDAVRLFVSRVGWHRHDFAVTEGNAPTIGTICRRLDGIPLALELAAARANVLTLRQLADRLDDALEVLSAGPRGATARHQTLKATLDWSYQLLDADERALFRRLAVFADSWTLAAAETICSIDDLPTERILGLHGQLAAKSLLQVALETEEARYRLLEPVRQYAGERLQASGELKTLRQRHAQHYLALAEEAEAYLTGPGQATWLSRVAREQENLRAALVCFDEYADRGSALRLAGALGRFWWAEGYIDEGQWWLSRELAVTEGEHRAARAKALTAAFTMAHRRGDYDTALSLAQESLTLAQEDDDRIGVGWALAELGMVAAETGGNQQALFQESLEIFRAVGDTAGIAEVLNMLGEVKRAQGDCLAAIQFYEESLTLWRRLGDEQYIATILHNLGRVTQHFGDSQRSATLLVDSMSRFQRLHITNGVALCLRGLAGVAVALDWPEVAARFLGAAETLAERAGVVEDSADRAQTQSALDAARARLGEARFHAAWSTGKTLTVDTAVKDALEFAARLPTPAHPPNESKQAPPQPDPTGS